MTTVITGATLIDGTDAEPVRDASVVIEGERIVEAGRLDHLPPDAEVIDVAGKTVLPGLIDSHVHFCSSWGSMQQRALAPPTLAAFEAAENARVTLDAGFTSVREASGSPQGFKLAVERGLIPGPRMRIAVGALSQTGGHGDGVLPSGVRFWRHWGPEWVETICDGPDEVRKTVRTILRLGAEDRAHATGGVMSPSDEPGSPQFTEEEIGVMVYEARMQGKTCMAHAQATAGIKNAVRAGVESIEHGFYLDDEAIALMRERGAFLVPDDPCAAQHRAAREGAARVGAAVVAAQGARGDRGERRELPRRARGRRADRDGHRRGRRQARHERLGARAHDPARHDAAKGDRRDHQDRQRVHPHGRRGRRPRGGEARRSARR